MGSEILPVIYILIIGLSVFFFVQTLFAQNEDVKALQWASNNAPEKSSSKLIEASRTLVHQFTLQHALRIKSPKLRARIQKNLLTAGLSEELNVDEFIGLQILWGVLFPAILILLNFSLNLGYEYYYFVLVAVLGYQMPNYHLRQKRQERVTTILAEMPFYLDLLALSTKAGKDFQGAMERIVDKADNSSVLAREFGIVLRDISLGSSRAEALKRLIDRVDVNEITSLVNIIIDADATGASIEKVLRDQSAQVRLERFLRAEKAGARASQLMLMPLIFFILPAVFIMVFAPVALQFFYGR